MKEKMILELVQQIYNSFLRDTIAKLIDNPDSQIDDYVMKVLDFLLGEK